MGTKHSREIRKSRAKGPQRDQWEWEYERAIVAKCLPGPYLDKVLSRGTVRGLVAGHCYHKSELEALRKILGVTVSRWPDIKLHRHTDELVAMIGFFVQIERRNSPGSRITEIKKRLIKPAETLLDAIVDPDFEREFYQPWGKLRLRDRDALVKILKKISARAAMHQEALRQRSVKGQQWDSLLKERFVNLVAMLCEYINHSFEPKRTVQDGNEEKSKFRDIVEILGSPIFPKEEGKDSSFDGAIRSHVDNWNYQIKTLAKMSPEAARKFLMDEKR